MSDADGASRRPPRALIVDDDSAAVKFIADRCLKMGVAVETAPNGLQALVKARQNPPDVLIVDMRMPGLDGLSLCTTLLGPGRKGIDIILISGCADDETVARADSLGAAFAAKGPSLWNTLRGNLETMFPGMTVELLGDEKPPTGRVRERPIVLVIDDDPDVAKFLLSRLQKCGVDALSAPNGLRGYQIAAREKPNLIISDCAMPEADINFLMWRLRSTPALEKTPVLAITARDYDTATLDALKRELFGRRGVEAIFKKPLDIDALFTAIQKYCPLEYTSWRGRAIA
jgi:CheY-like chemotaxis protein